MHDSVAWSEEVLMSASLIDDTVLTAARQAAERAVEDMPDGPMKLKAFEVILNRMLSPAIENSPVASLRRPRKLAFAAKAKAVPDVPADSPPKSSPERILALRDDNFFAEPKGLAEIRDALALRGWVYPLTSLSGRMQGLVQRRQLRRVQDGKKKTYRYVNP
jgi:hypothetical protein